MKINESFPKLTNILIDNFYDVNKILYFNVDLIDNNVINVNIIISDVLGKILQSSHLELHKGQNSITLDKNIYSNNIYFIQFQTEDGFLRTYKTILK